MPAGELIDLQLTADHVLVATECCSATAKEVGWSTCHVGLLMMTFSMYCLSRKNLLVKFLILNILTVRCFLCCIEY